MKAKIGTKLREIREDRKMTQEGIASILGIDDSAYGRLERNETQADFTTVIRFAEKLNVPVQDFFPELTSISNNHNQGTAGAGIVFGNINYYASPDDAVREVSTENTLLKEKITLLEEQNRLLHNLLERMNVK